jgi:hypothetical protein
MAWASGLWNICSESKPFGQGVDHVLLGLRLGDEVAQELEQGVPWLVGVEVAPTSSLSYAPRPMPT